MVKEHLSSDVAIMKSYKSMFLITAFSLWWLLFLNISFFSDTEFIAPRNYTYILVNIFIISFFIGGLLCALTDKKYYKSTVQKYQQKNPFSLYLLTAIFASILIYLLIKSGALSLSFIEYFALRRGGDLDFAPPSNIYDSLISYLAFPLNLYLIIANRSKKLSIVAYLFMMGFAYLYQVNYPFIYIFWVLIVRVAVEPFLEIKKIVTLVLFFAAAIVAASVNRFGEFDVIGIVKYYFINYHIVGFSIFDYIFHDISSPIHIHTYGAWSLGSIVHIPSIILSNIGFPYPLTAYDNYSSYMSGGFELGRYEIKTVNAFNTMIATFFKDFSFLGFVIPPFLYGFLIVKFCNGSVNSVYKKNLFILLSFAWIIGFMISPIERPFFGIVIIIILIYDFNSHSPRLIGLGES